MPDYDDFDGVDRPSMEDLIKQTEEESDFDSFLSQKVPSWPVSDAVENSSGVSGEQAGTDSSRTSNAEPVIDPRLVAMKDPNYVTNGHVTRSHQDAKAEGESPMPVIDVMEITVPTVIPEQIPETRTEMEVRSHPMLGTYIAEQTVVIGTDPWFAEVFINARNAGVSEMKPEEIIKKIYDNEEAIRRTNAVNQGLKSALSVHISGMNAGERAKLLERDKAYRPKKSEVKVGEDGKVTAKVAKKSSNKTTKSPMAKAIKTYRDSMGFNKQEVIDEITSRGKMTAEVMADIEIVFGGEV